MIIRSVARAGRRALVQTSSQPWRRFLATQTDTIETTAENSFKQFHSLEAQFNATAPPQEAVPSFDPAAASAPASAHVTDSVAEQYHRFKQSQALIGKLGSYITPHYQPHTLLSNPPSPADVTLELLLASEAHQGHATSLWNPANARYIHGIRQGVHIISLEATAAHLRRAAKVVQEVSRRGGLVLFVGTRDGQDRAVARASELAKGYHLFERWIPGSITNGQQILSKCRTKVVNGKDEEIPGFEEQLMERPVLRPDLVVCMNPLENYVLLHECALNNIPTIGVIDTNADPTWVTYPIPANDDSLRCIQVIAGVLGRAGEAGQKQRLELAETGRVTYRPADNLVLPEALQEKTVAAAEPGAEMDLDESLEDADELADKLDMANNREMSNHAARAIKKID
ncbi:ribosomal protein S2 [Karstenula rhodostoma CBS 690.94]|uniref:Ribosomal protein S2 n=1 Tax=Karstenula rhodostoma CBS 690.94 TaxID=1392251 RepID=A0A9P4PH81_9PLEO|nr:ribosomal protein S2 [Karstenula rhodostoma CBS 690.94]